MDKKMREQAQISTSVDEHVGIWCDDSTRDNLVWLFHILKHWNRVHEINN